MGLLFDVKVVVGSVADEGGAVVPIGFVCVVFVSVGFVCVVFVCVVFVFVFDTNSLDYQPWKCSARVGWKPSCPYLD